MSPSACVLDLAVDLLHDTGAPTAIVPVRYGGQAGVFYASYEGDAEWMALTYAADPEELAIACCIRARNDALVRGGRLGITGAHDA